MAAGLNQNHGPPKASLFGGEYGRSLGHPPRVVEPSCSPVRLSEVEVRLDQPRIELNCPLERDNCSGDIIEPKLSQSKVIRGLLVPRGILEGSPQLLDRCFEFVF